MESENINKEITEETTKEIANEAPMKKVYYYPYYIELTHEHRYYYPVEKKFSDHFADWKW